MCNTQYNVCTEVCEECDNFDKCVTTECECCYDCDLKNKCSRCAKENQLYKI